MRVFDFKKSTLKTAADRHRIPSNNGIYNFGEVFGRIWLDAFVFVTPVLLLGGVPTKIFVVSGYILFSGIQCKTKKSKNKIAVLNHTPWGYAHRVCPQSVPTVRRTG